MELYSSLLRKDVKSKIVMVVVDGIGGLPREDGQTELECARTPNLDELARQSECGLVEAVGAGISPGSGPGHFALFGYDPLEYQVGRGVLSALGLGFELKDTDLAVRANFCTLENDGTIADRRAGRIPTEKNIELCEKLRAIEVEGVEIFVITEKEHRFCVVFRGDGLEEGVPDTDPGVEGVPPLELRAERPEAERSARVAKEFIEKARKVLKDEKPANMILTRGYAKRPSWESVKERFGLKAGAIAGYPAYRGMAKLVGMEILHCGETLEDQVKVLPQNIDSFDYIFLHFKKTDKYGEDGNFEAKVRAIEEFDEVVPEILETGVDVVAITGDHSTPWSFKQHSWHPSPLLIYSKYARWGFSKAFSERECGRGSLGRIKAIELMPLLLAHSGRLKKFGA